MLITDKSIAQAHSDLKDVHGGLQNDYFALLYLEQTFHLPREEALLQATFGGNDYGFDAFHFDRQAANLYLFQFKWSDNAALFKESFERMIYAGMDRVFGNPCQDQRQNQAVLQLKSMLAANKNLINCVFIHFVFRGNPEEANRSKTLERLQEDLEGKKFLIQEFFGRPVEMVIEFRSSQTRKIGGQRIVTRTHSYPLTLTEAIQRQGPSGEVMHIAFARLTDLHGMYLDMGQRFFERNIRAALSEDEAPNRAITKSLRDIVLEEKEAAAAFAFNHNGITLSAEKLENQNGQYRITEPRVLNGAQTISTFAGFMKKNEANPRLKEQKPVIDDIWVLCRIITNARPEFIIQVTINNNRQNPVKAWALHANDIIQLQLADKFVEDLNIYYERQQNAFHNLTDEELEAMEVAQKRAIELRRLALTLLASDGEVDKMSRLGEVFETEKPYAQVFDTARLRADSRQILLCYKVNFCLGRVIDEIISRGENRYFFARRARNLIWALLTQAMLNDHELEDKLQKYGETISVESGFREWIYYLAGNRVRHILKTLVDMKPYCELIREERYDFLRTKAVYDKCMEIAWRKWKWIQKRLK